MKNFEVTVSIIMPAYNCENEIGKSIESVIKQEFSDFELLIINDGSTDNTSNVIKEYMKLDNRIHLLEQTNSGPSAARNKGLNEAKGKYIMFLDSDDEYFDNTIVTLLKTIENSEAELVVGYFITNFDDLNTKLKIKNKLFYDKQCMIDYLISKKIFNTNWNKIYLNDIIQKNNLKFDISIRNGEDMRFNFEYISYINKTVVTNQVVYKYYYNENGLTSKNKSLLGQTVVNDLNFQLDYYNKFNYDKSRLMKRIAKSIFYINDLDFIFTSDDYKAIFFKTKNESFLCYLIYLIIHNDFKFIIKFLLCLIKLLK